MVPSVLNGMKSSYWSIPNSGVLSDGSSDTVIPNDLIWFGLMREWSVYFPKNRAKFIINMYTVPSSCTTAVVYIPTGTLAIASYEL